MQKLAKRAFPCLSGKDLDRLLKGHFFQALLPKWQCRLGAPKVEESFDELLAVHMSLSVMSSSIVTWLRSVRIKDKTKKTDDTDSSRDRGSGSSSKTSTGVLLSSNDDAGDKHPRKHGQGILCKARGRNIMQPTLRLVSLIQ